MKSYRRAFAAAFCAACGFVLTLVSAGCGQSSPADNRQSQAVSDNAATKDEVDAPAGLAALGLDPTALDIYPEVTHDTNHKAGFQLEPPQDGDTIAVIHTTMGDITLRFFPDLAPKTVTNFINLAQDGKYNNTTFHKVIADYGIQGGHCGDSADNPNGLSSYGGEFEDEFCDSLFNIRGAVSMANTAKDSNGSRFFINQTNAETFKTNGGWKVYDNIWEDVKTQLHNYKDSNLLSAFIEENGNRFINTEIIPNEVKALYDSNGGNPDLDGAFNAADRGNTVFAQVIDGMDVVDKIAAVRVDKKNVPNENVVITSIDIETY